jgi:hypothetical protein
MVLSAGSGYVQVSPPSTLRAAKMPAPALLHEANSCSGLVGFLAMAHSLSSPVFSEVLMSGPA